VERHGSFDPGQWFFDHTGGSVWDDPRIKKLQAMGITAEYVEREIGKDEYLETTEHSFGPMKKLYTLVEFSPAVNRELRQRWDAIERRERFSMVGLGATGVLGLLGMVWGLLKIDTATKGYYSKRLFIGVPAVIIGATLLSLLAFMS
jgi:hypothetical protein